MHLFLIQIQMIDLVSINIQVNTLNLLLTLISVIRAKTRLVRDSATAILAPASQFTKPFIGCSPIAVAAPSYGQIITIGDQALLYFYMFGSASMNC